MDESTHDSHLENSSSKFSFHVLIAHYGDLFWTETAIHYWTKTDISAITISFQESDLQASTAQEIIGRWSSSYPEILFQAIPTESSIHRHASFDHAAAIEMLRASTVGSSDFFIIADPDFWVLAPSAMNASLRHWSANQGYILMADHQNLSLSHPCFSMFEAKAFENLDLFLGMKDFQHDFGRLWAGNLQSPGHSVPSVPVQLASWGGLLVPRSRRAAFL